MLWTTRARNERRQVGLRKQPGVRERAHVRPSLGGDTRERLECVEDAVVEERPVRARPQLHPRTGRRRLTSPIFAGEPTAGERAEGLVPDAVLAAERQHLLLVAAIEQRIGVLHERGLAGRERRPQVVGRDVAHPVRAYLSAVDELLECADRLLDRRVGIGRVREVEIDVVDLEPLEARLDLPQDPVATEPVILSDVHGSERLRRDRRPVPGRRNPLSDRGLAATAAVRIRRVERRQAERPRGLHDRERLVVGLPGLAEELGRGADPAEIATAEHDPFEADAGRAELALFHRAILRTLGHDAFVFACPPVPPAPPPGADRPRYMLDVRIANDLKTVEGDVTVRFTPNRPTSRLVFRLWPN